VPAAKAGDSVPADSTRLASEASDEAEADARVITTV
jgi:hypothetical protein